MSIKNCNRHSTNKYQQKYVNNCVVLIVIELKLRKFIFSKKLVSQFKYPWLNSS